MIKVTGFKFTPIHNFVPQIQQNNFKGGAKIDPSTGAKSEAGYFNFIKSFGEERYIALSTGQSDTDENSKTYGAGGRNNYGNSETGETDFEAKNYIPLPPDENFSQKEVTISNN